MGILAERRAVRVDEIAEELHATRRTVYRDLIVLAGVGVPIISEQVGRRTRWRVLDTYKKTLRVTLAWPELVSLVAGRDLIAAVSGSPLHRAASLALEKIAAAIPDPIATQALAVARHVSSGGSTGDYSERAAAIETVITAIEREETVCLRYRKAGQRRFADRRVDPYHLHIHAGGLYLLGFCHERRAVRTFALFRVGTATLTGERFTRSAEVVPGAYFHGGFGPWSGKTERVRLRFTADTAPHVAARKMHPSQSAQQRNDGQLDVALEVPVSPALVAWVVGFGPRVEVLGPRGLREAVRREHEDAARSFGEKK